MPRFGTYQFRNPMGRTSLVRRPSQPASHLAWLVSLGLVGLLAPQPASAQEKAITRTATDPQLSWGPCPAFLPPGCGIAVLHGDPAKDNVDVFLRVPPRSTLPLHLHTSAERMVLVAGELHVSYDNQPKVVLKTGTYAYGPARLPHSGYCASSVPCILFIAFESPLDAVPVNRSVSGVSAR
jgi:quercetin dioxygenase-like cupin family protein